MALVTTPASSGHRAGAGYRYDVLADSRDPDDEVTAERAPRTAERRWQACGTEVTRIRAEYQRTQDDLEAAYARWEEISAQFELAAGPPLAR